MITKCRAVQLAIALCASLFGTHACGEDFQIVTIASEVVAVPANNFEVEIVYNTSNSNANLPGLGLRVHFDAAKLTWVQNTFINELDLIGISPPMTDVEDFDNDPDTDMYIHFAWASLGGDWPGQIPAALAHLEFSTLGSFDGATINFSTSGTATGYAFESSPAQIALSNSAIDFDDDGLPDECDAACLAAGITADTDDDGDGVTDVQEALDGTDPLDGDDFIAREEPLSGVVSDWKNKLPIADVIVSAVGSDSESFSAEASGDPLGRYAFVDKYAGKNNLTFSKATSSDRLSKAISSQDALAALKLAVGLNPNFDPDGDGPDEALAVSDYQRIAADMNADGAINSQDALAILKASVGLGDFAPRWVFVPEDHALSFEAGIDLSQFDSIEVDYPATEKVDVIGILVGDVDGNWEGPTVTDEDGDGFYLFEDAFPEDPSEWLDTDGDGIGNNVDTDDDGDGVADANDGFPQISTGSLTDTDADGLPDDCDVACQATGLTADLDDDGDNVLDVNDALPLISLAGNLDTDQNGLPDECDTACLALGLIADTDDDGDGALDYEDPFPLDAEVSEGRKAPSNLGLIE